MGGAPHDRARHLRAVRPYRRLGGPLVWNANFGFVGAMLDPAGVAQIWGDGTEPVFANSGQPGTAEPVDGGYRLSGEWKIVSGIPVPTG